MKRVYESLKLSDNLEIARSIINACSNERIFAFFGQLGAGKTTLIKEFCRVLGVEETVSSPTFTLVHEYQGRGVPLYHFDFYRLKSEEEAYELGCEEYFDSGSYCFLEWPERIPNLLPEEYVKIYLSFHPGTGRLIEVQYGESSTLT